MSEILGPNTAEGIGFEPPHLRQFTVFLDNRVGRLQTLVRHLEEAEDALVALSIEESADSALVRLICSNPDMGQGILHQHGFAFSQSEVLAVELPRQTKHPLSAICSALLAAEINIHYVYPLLTQPRPGPRPLGPVLILYVDDPILAAQVLIKKGFTLVGETDLRP
jgi:hypothetical protein